MLKISLQSNLTDHILACNVIEIPPCDFSMLYNNYAFNHYTFQNLKSKFLKRNAFYFCSQYILLYNMTIYLFHQFTSCGREISPNEGETVQILKLLSQQAHFLVLKTTTSGKNCAFSLRTS